MHVANIVSVPGFVCAPRTQFENKLCFFLFFDISCLRLLIGDDELS
jgi:hypothetical protein